MLNYANGKEAKADCDVLRGLLLALEVSKRTLRRDECGAWRILGRKGHVYTWRPSGGWLLFCNAGTARKWSAIKRRLAFCKATQDGDIEGCLRLFGLPTPEQAIAIRKALGLKRKRAANADSFAGINLASAKRGLSGAPASEKGKGAVAVDPDAPARKYRPNPQIDEPEVAQSRFRRRGR
jgi:hypothetical protein